MTSPGDLIADVRRTHGLTLDELADRSGTSAPTISNYERGHKEPRFDTTARILMAAGYELRLEAVPRGLGRALTRKDRRSLAMHRLVAVRLLSDPGFVRGKARQNLTTLRAADDAGHASTYLDAWERLLNGPTDALVETLTSERQSARDLRQVSPFAGVVDQSERLRIIEGIR